MTMPVMKRRRKQTGGGITIVCRVSNYYHFLSSDITSLYSIAKTVLYINRIRQDNLPWLNYCIKREDSHIIDNCVVD